MTHTMDESVREVFDAFPREIREPLMAIRTLIWDVAKTTSGVGPLLETLKWGQPSYLPAQTRSGTTVRLGRHGDDSIGLFVPCQTSLVGQFRGLFPALEYSGNRAIVMNPHGEILVPELTQCIRMALTYRRAERGGR